ncbi:trypsin-like peptidase domain-containing protein [Zhouia spongiae]|uniref:Trypsin-like peptidase domain-containing protein n=1 Tax=Zhouia spongiae TaxID=2202721 RepID=A0ABY3YKS6_9FLAO|nr:trypsin-like peptidase domain-containing protein [Zhouia spongiae]UNY98252.1 trypsin-like peptidase domain-containing protein [Zhouia spongiae]
MKRFASLLFVSVLGGVITLGAYKAFVEKDTIVVDSEAIQPKFVTTNYNGATPPNPIADVDFTEAADKTVHSVVHVSNVSVYRSPVSIFDLWRGSGGGEQTRVGTGSGVIISPDGYIVTNNHVIDNASKLQVTLNDNKTYEAELIGSDPSTDIALLKINTGEELPYLAFGNSDNTKVGEWVLAVGNPFNLTSTVTAGIISAKARDLGKNQSFIQTDAAVNPGNSGGALVNTNGDLIGINTAITSQTGSYIGYSFAVPSNIAKKIVEDILEYGDIQEGKLGIYPRELNSLVAEKLHISNSSGIYINKVIEDSGADKAGLKEGDIIIKIDDKSITSNAQLTGFLKSKRPNDRVHVTVLRNGAEKTVPVTLFKDQTYVANSLGFVVKNMSEKDIKKYKTKGVKITNVASAWDGYNFEGKIITHINDEKVDGIDDVKNMLENAEGYRVKVTFINDEGEKESIYFR